MDGFLLVNKPAGPSSYDIVREAKRALGIKRIGHNGTLDPLATGLLVLALGSATRLLPLLPGEPKTYHFGIQFGITTDTLDKSGEIITSGMPIPSRSRVESALSAFQGTFLQKPPLFSAIKINGQRAYKLARQQKKIDIPAKKVTVSSLKLLRHNEKSGTAFFKAECSKGTYVRSLARDLAEYLGSVGFASEIQRTAIGTLKIQDSLTFAEIEKKGRECIIPIASIFAQFPSYKASPSQVKDLLHGRKIHTQIPNSTSIQQLFVYSQQMQLVAVTEKIAANIYHPIKVLGTL